MKSEIHSIYMSFEDRVSKHTESIKDKLIVSIGYLSGTNPIRPIQGYRVYFKTEEDMILFKLKYNI